MVQRDHLLPSRLHLRLHQRLGRVQLLQIHHRIQKSPQIGRVQVQTKDVFNEQFLDLFYTLISSGTRNMNLAPTYRHRQTFFLLPSFRLDLSFAQYLIFSEN